jgi:flagellar assembly protein FliH
MAQQFQLEVFELPDTSGGPVELREGELEELRLVSFEKGYAAGWDDAVAAADGEDGRFRADLAQNLLDMSFTYQEARSQILRGIEPLLREMVAKVLPVAARQTLGPIILEQLHPLADELAGARVQVTSHPSNQALIEPLLMTSGALPLNFVGEPSLSPGQAHLKFGNQEVQVDLDAAIDAIGKAIAAFFAVEHEKEIKRA